MEKLIICIDGFGRDLISKKSTPFLYKLGNENYFTELETLFAFTEERSFFSGKTPLEHGKWMEFEKTENSVLRNPLIRIFSFNKKLRDYMGIAFQFLKKRTWFARTYQIPSNKLQYFDSSIKRGLWTLDFFKNKNFVMYKWPFFVIGKNKKEKIKLVFKYESDSKRLKRLFNEENGGIYYTQLMEIDKVIHKFGKKGVQTREVLKKIDNLLKRYSLKFLRDNKDAEIFLWSDHGFVDIKKYINIIEVLPKRKAYLSFIAGTTAHFWFENEDAKKDVLNSLKKIKEIKLLDKKLAREYKVPLDKKYGEVVVFLEKGNYFFPNFYQKNEKEKFVSMHGYPEDKELNGFIMSNKKLPKKLKIENAIAYLK